MIQLAITFWLILKSLWFVWFFAFILAATPIIVNISIRKIKAWQLKRWLKEHKKLEDWKKLDGREFEKIVALIYQNLGYKTKVVGGAGDRGIDIVMKKDNKTWFIQCKQMKVVSPKDVREFIGSLAEGEKGFLVTTGNFTTEGKESVKDKPIELINGYELEKLVKSTAI